MQDSITKRVFATCLMVLTAALVVAAVFAFRNMLMDDACIGFRYVDNFLSGKGMVFNPPDRVEGVTNIGWLLLLALPSCVLPIHLAAKALSFVLVLATLVLCRRIITALTDNRDPILTGLTCLGIVISFDYVFFSLTGMETALLSACLCLAVDLALHTGRRMIPAALCAFAYLVHPEASLVFPLALAAALLLQRRDATRWIPSAILFVCLVAAVTALRRFYYGSPLPNTFYAKPVAATSLLDRLSDVLVAPTSNISPLFAGPLVVILIGYGAWTACRRSAAGVYLFGTMTAGYIFCLYAEPDWTGRGRYFAGYLPVAYILLAVGVSDIASRLRARGAGAAAAWTPRAVMIVMLACTGAGTITCYRLAMEGEYPWHVMTGTALLGPSRWIGTNTEPDAVIATRRIGALAYVSKRNVFDYKFGLTDRKVARLVRAHGRHFELPSDEALADLWRERPPDYLLEDHWVVQKIAGRPDIDTGTFPIHGIEYRTRKIFSITPSVRWVLCERVTPRRTGSPPLP